MNVRFEPIPEGYRIWDGDRLAGVLATNEHMTPQDVADAIAGNKIPPEILNAMRHSEGKDKLAEVLKQSPVCWKPMTSDHWTIHLTRPSVHVDLMKAIVAGIPAG